MQLKKEWQIPKIKNYINVHFIKGQNNKIKDLEEESEIISDYLSLKYYNKDKANPFLFKNILSPFRNLTSYKKIDRKRKINDTGCKITAIDCGQGESFLIENKGEVALIDFGKDKGNVARYLKTYVKKPIKFAILTHLHDDHMGDFINIVKNSDIKEIILLNSRQQEEPTRKELLKYQNYEKIRCDKINFITTQDISNGLSFNVGNIFFRFLSPADLYKNENDNSLVLLANYKDKNFIFLGDVSLKAEKQIIKNCYQNNIDLSKTVIVKVAHHCSKYSSSETFLNEFADNFYSIISCAKENIYADNFYSIISCAKENIYGHPDKKTLERLKKHGPVYCTYEEGNITLTIKKEKGISVNTERESYKLPRRRKNLNRKNSSQASNKIHSEFDNKNSLDEIDLNNLYMF